MNTTAQPQEQAFTQGTVASTILLLLNTCGTAGELEAMLKAQPKQPNGESFQVVRHAENAFWYYTPEEFRSMRSFVFSVVMSYKHSTVTG